MIKKHYIVNSLNGLTSRMSTNLVSCANHFKSDIMLVYGEETANLKSIMNVMALVIRQGESFTITSDGIDEQGSIEAIEKLMKEISLI